jgi:DNA repair photolyase
VDVARQEPARLKAFGEVGEIGGGLAGGAGLREGFQNAGGAGLLHEREERRSSEERTCRDSPALLPGVSYAHLGAAREVAEHRLADGGASRHTDRPFSMRPIPANNPPNPFAESLVEYFEDVAAMREQQLQIYEDHTKEILAKNDSPDIGFTYSVNPYRGCFHACSYCYARPTHEYLSFGSGTDFERKIVVKPKAPALLREAFEKRSWKGELLMLSGNTDCYQPLENSYRLTRGILEVCAEYRNPVHIITKSPIIERDIDVLSKLVAEASLGVSVSIPFWTEATARALEPFVTTPARRMKTVERLSNAGIPVTVNIAPLILGLGDRDVPKILEAAAAAGARGASLIPLRLPGSVKDVFSERLKAAFPLSAEKVLKRTREMRGGKLYDSEFGRRMQAEGEFFETVQRMFEATCLRLGLNQDHLRYPVREGTFRRPTDKNGQLKLF